MENKNHGNISKVLKVENQKDWDSIFQKPHIQETLVVVHFGASWCIPSVAMNSFFEEMASTHPDAVFVSVDVDDVKELALHMEVKAMPTFILIKHCKKVDRLVGANPDEVRRRVDGFLQSSGVDMA